MPVRKSTSDVASMAWRPWFSSRVGDGDAPRHFELCTGRCSTVLGAASGRSLSVICPKVVLTLTVDMIILRNRCSLAAHGCESIFLPGRRAELAACNTLGTQQKAKSCIRRGTALLSAVLSCSHSSRFELPPLSRLETPIRSLQKRCPRTTHLCTRRSDGQH